MKERTQLKSVKFTSNILDRTTQVIRRLVNTIILNWVGAVICQHTTHSADETA